MHRFIACAALALLGANSLPACNIGQVDCTPHYVYAVNATVRSARTGAPIADATLTLVDGAYRETMRPERTAGEYTGAGERPGTYVLTASAPGFQPATPRTLVVERDDDGCHVLGQRVTIDLAPL